MYYVGIYIVYFTVQFNIDLTLRSLNVNGDETIANIKFANCLAKIGSKTREKAVSYTHLTLPTIYSV